MHGHVRLSADHLYPKEVFMRLYVFMSVLTILFTATCLVEAQEESMNNVFENIPYQGSGLGKRKLIDQPHVLMMQIALKPGQGVPAHTANSNVHLLVLQGSVDLITTGQQHSLETGSLTPVAYKTEMEIRNTGTENATFLVIKTPHPDKM